MTEDKKIVVHADVDLEDLIPGFLENKCKEIVEIESLLASGDYETVQRLGHSMKGAGGGYGFDKITDIGMHIEQAAKEKNAAEIASQLEALSRYLDCVEVVYD
ncbi:MAG: Hpt domain-containing protein [Deltaproteobacteria bacterium]|nr:Hpt domain-containing protein [Deltaproteobacteria bacterium]